MLSSSVRFIRLIAATIAALAALAGTALSAEAAPTCGNKLCLETTHEPDSDFVIPSGYLIYRVAVTSVGTSTATKVTLTFDLDDRVTLQSSPDGCSQPPADEITCDLGSVEPSETPLVFRFLVQVPATETAANAPLSSQATIAGDARRNDKGNNPNDPTNESFSDAPEIVAVDLREGRSASAVPEDQVVTLDTDVDGEGATREDKRTAKFTVFSNGFFTSAAIDDEVPDNSFVCPTGLFCPSGGWTQAIIPGPFGLFDQFTGASFIIIELDYDSRTVPADLTEENYVLIHDRDYNDPLHPLDLELISEHCSPTQGPPCLIDVDELPGGDFHVIARVTGNFRYR
jgi:hypothetical protein